MARLNARRCIACRCSSAHELHHRYAWISANGMILAIPIDLGLGIREDGRMGFSGRRSWITKFTQQILWPARMRNHKNLSPFLASFPLSRLPEMVSNSNTFERQNFKFHKIAPIAYAPVVGNTWYVRLWKPPFPSCEWVHWFEREPVESRPGLSIP